MGTAKHEAPTSTGDPVMDRPELHTLLQDYARCHIGVRNGIRVGWARAYEIWGEGLRRAIGLLDSDSFDRSEIESLRRLLAEPPICTGGERRISGSPGEGRSD